MFKISLFFKTVLPKCFCTQSYHFTDITKFVLGKSGGDDTFIRKKIPIETLFGEVVLLGTIQRRVEDAFVQLSHVARKR